MADAPKYTPYKDGFPGFQIALNRLDEDDWIETDVNLAERLALKERLFTEDLPTVWRAEADTLNAQTEVWSMLTAFLPKRFPDIYGAGKDGITVHPTGQTISLDEQAPLLSASRLVDEDLCLMVRHEDGWRLDAASLCFPSHWSLAEKIGRPMHQIHTPVPGFVDGLADRVNRIFDNMKPELPVWRLNWSLHDGAELSLPHPPSKPRFSGDADSAIPAKSWLRIERQTLRRLPETGAILFTIKTYMDPLAALKRLDPGLVSDIADAIAAMTPAQLAYKGLTAERDRVIAALRAEASRL